MSTMYGADVAELRRLSSEFHAAADALDRDGGNLTRLLNSVDWLGGVASRFTNQWTGVQIPRIGLSTRFLREAADQLARNADQQERASRNAGPRGDGLGLSDVTGGGAAYWRSRGVTLPNESRIGFSTSRSLGLLIRGGRSDGFEAVYGSDGNRATYTTRSELTIDTGDVFRVLGFVGAVKGKDTSPISFGFGMTSFEGTQFIWDQQPFSTENELKGVNSIPTKQTSASNFFTGYDAGEVLTDIESGKLARPDAIVQLTGLKTFDAAQVESGTSVFGANSEVTVQRAIERWSDGTTVDAYTMSGEMTSAGGAHLDTKLLGSSVDVKAVVGSETSVTVATEYAPDGTPTRLVYTVVGHSEIGGELALNVAGGGASWTESTGALVERELSFDLGDPRVADLVQSGSTSDLLAYQEWASESVKVFATQGSGLSSDAIVFRADAESSSMELVGSATRPPIGNPSEYYVEGRNGMGYNEEYGGYISSF